MTSTITPATPPTAPPTARLTLGELAAKVTGNYLLRQLLKAILTIWLVSTITFFVIRAMPGNAVDILIQDLTAQGVSPEDARNQAAALMNIDLNQPMAGQYIDYLVNIAHGDLGMSYKSAGLPVAAAIAQVLP